MDSNSSHVRLTTTSEMTSSQHRDDTRKMSVEMLTNHDGDARPSRCYKRPTKCGPVRGGVWCFRKKTDTFAFTSLCCGVIFLACAFILPLVLTGLLNDGISDMLVMDSSKSASYAGWETTAGDQDAPAIYYDLYMFDVVNTDDFVCNGNGGPYVGGKPSKPCKGGAPQLVERGPYAYRKFWRRFDVKWTEGGNKVTYQEYDWYEWNPERSGYGLRESDVLTQPSLAANLVKNLLQEGAAMVPTGDAASVGSTSVGSAGRVKGALLTPLEAKIRQGVAQVASALRHGALDKKRSGAASSRRALKPPFAVDGGAYELSAEAAAEGEAAAAAVEALGASVAGAFGGVQDVFHGDGWRLLMKLVLCAAPPAGPSPFHSRPAKDLYWGYWGDPILSLLAAIIEATGEPFLTYIPGFATNYTSQSEAKRRTSPTTTLTGKDDLKKINQYVYYWNMDKLFVCLASDQSTGDEAKQLPAICPTFQVGWTVAEALAHGWKTPWNDVDSVPIAGFGDANGFEPLHGVAPGQSLPPDWRHEDRSVFISDIYRSVDLEHSKTYDWRDITLSRMTIKLADMASASPDWAWPTPADANPANAAFDGFMPSGMLNMTTLSGGAQVFASKPHFLDGHPWLQGQFKGALHPNRDRHDTYLDVEPTTGAPFRIAERLQLNVVVSDWNLPSVPLYDYFGWDTDAEKAVVKQALEGAWVAIRDAVVTGVEAAVHDALYAPDGFCTVSAADHLKSCEATAHHLNGVIFNLTYAWCHRSPSPTSDPTAHPAPLPTASPTARPSPHPTMAPVLAPTPAAGNGTRRRLLDDDAAAATAAPRLLASAAGPSDGQHGGEAASNPVCDVLGPLYDQSKYLSDHLLAEALVEVQHRCVENPGTCDQYKAVIRKQVQNKYDKKCGPGANKGAGPTPEERALCAAAVAVGRGALEVFGGVERFCLGGVCELVEALTHVPEAPCKTLRDRRNATCTGLEAWADNIIETECGSGKNWTVPLGGDSHATITIEMVCGMVHKLVLENSFDDEGSKWGKWNYPFPHGQFWKVADEFCAGNPGTCKAISKKVQAGVDDYCLDPDSGLPNEDHASICAAGLYAVEHWAQIDEKIVGGLSKFEAFCSRDFCANPLGPGVKNATLGPLQQLRLQVATKVLTFCESETPLDLDAPFDHSHPWLHLAAECPKIVAMVKEKTGSYCEDHEFECSVVSKIPWRTVPMDDNGGPVLSWIEATVIPKVENVTARLKAWCDGPFEPDGVTPVPAWHADACAAVQAFARAELSRAFDAVVAALDGLAPQLNLTAKAASAEAWLTCVASHSEMKDFPPETAATPGYFIPLTWADEYMDLPKGYTDDFTAQVSSTQLLAISINLWCLVVAAVFGVVALATVLVRHLTKRDYEGEDRLLHRELVARKDMDLFDAPLGGQATTGTGYRGRQYDLGQSGRGAGGGGGGEGAAEDDALYSPLVEKGQGATGDTGHKLYKPFDRKRDNSNSWV